jgi:hypothetical protein
MGRREACYAVDTKDVFDKLRSLSLLVMPLVARPGAVVRHTGYGIIGVLDFNAVTGQCYDHLDGCYTMRVPSQQGAREASVDSLDCGTKLKITPLELEKMLLDVPTEVCVDTRGFTVDGVADRRIPEDALDETLLKCCVWYPHAGVDYTPEDVYVLAHSGEDMSATFTLMHCNVSWIVQSSDDISSTWNTIRSVRNLDA